MALKAKGVVIICLAVLFVFTSFVSNATASTKIFNVSGSPKIARAGQNEWTVCKKDMLINSGDHIKTSEGEVVDISFLDGIQKAVRIEEKSDVVISKTELPCRVDLLNGAVMTLIKNLPKDSTFEICTPTGITGARGTGWRVAHSGTKSAVYVYDNVIYYKSYNLANVATAYNIDLAQGTITMIDDSGVIISSQHMGVADQVYWTNWLAMLEGSGVLQPGEAPPAYGFGTSGSSTNNLDRAENSADSNEDALQNRLDNVSQNQDTNRIEERVVPQTKSEKPYTPPT